ncbi:uncharacterized protein LOC122531152 isoform X1 [Frieseomelitta varia]|uniref:uncharacterized protein LOC122531152 isoform X1 n=1 Tax=Frieseomelitta varia TaxID=561572 RepID=UPI001CB67D58|nr:uncharacterized protein LOC122531152 isoform X1 [Frieseomelitta varia]
MNVTFCRGMRFATTLGFSPILATRNFLETTRLIRCTDSKSWRLKFFERYPHYRNPSCNYVSFLNHIKTYEMPYKNKFGKNALVACYCNLNCNKGDTPKVQPMKKLSVFAKMKQMTKDYWHILIPVHIITNIGWIVIFYVAIKNGVDITNLMELMHFSNKYIETVNNSNVGNWALTYLLYKIFTPLRYTVTIGCTTMAIKQLSKSGMVKPLSFKTTEPSKTTTPWEIPLKIERQTKPPKT